MPDASTTTLSEQLEDCRRTLRDLSAAEGDASLWNQLAIWRAKAEKEGQVRAYAERALRLLLAGEPADDAVRIWRKAAGE